MENDEVKSEETSKTKKVDSSQKFKYAAIGGLIVLVVVGVAGSAYYFGVMQQKKKTTAETLKELINPTALLNLPKNTTGTVVSVEGEVLKVQNEQEGEKSITVAQDVPITKKGNPIKLEEVKSDDKATVLYQDIDGKLTATRILVR